MAKTLAELVGEALRVVPEISCDEARALLDASDRGGWHFVDVRESDEWGEGRIPGARHFPRGFLEVRADLEHPKRDPWLAVRGRKLLVYCGGGNRSALAAQTLIAMGFSEVASLAEGWSGWVRRGYPVER